MGIPALVKARIWDQYFHGVSRVSVIHFSELGQSRLLVIIAIVSLAALSGCGETEQTQPLRESKTQPQSRAERIVVDTPTPIRESRTQPQPRVERTVVDTPTPASVPTPTSREELDDVVMKMASISGRDSRETRQRFRFILTRLADKCPETSDPTRVANYLSAAYLRLEEAGLSGEEGLLALSNNLYYAVSSIEASIGAPMPKDACIEIFAMYTTLRWEGWSTREAKEGVVDIATSTYRLGQ